MRAQVILRVERVVKVIMILRAASAGMIPGGWAWYQVMRKGFNH